MLHQDTGAKGTYEFGKVAKADGPVAKDGKPVIDDFTPGKASRAVNRAGRSSFSHGRVQVSVMAATGATHSPRRLALPCPTNRRGRKRRPAGRATAGVIPGPL